METFGLERGEEGGRQARTGQKDITLPIVGGRHSGACGKTYKPITCHFAYPFITNQLSQALAEKVKRYYSYVHIHGFRQRLHVLHTVPLGTTASFTVNPFTQRNNSLNSKVLDEGSILKPIYFKEQPTVQQPERVVRNDGYFRDTTVPRELFPHSIFQYTTTTQLRISLILERGASRGTQGEGASCNDKPCDQAWSPSRL